MHVECRSRAAQLGAVCAHYAHISGMQYKYGGHTATLKQYFYSDAETLLDLNTFALKPTPL